VTTESDAERLARRLREVREYLGLTQQFVSAQTGLNRTAIVEIERGARRVESLELKRLANLYRYPVEFFLRDEESEGSSSADTSSLAALARAAGELTDEDRREILRYAEFLRNYKRTRSNE
jgi:transcriptional regulator with XRE-family HTH domain